MENKIPKNPISFGLFITKIHKKWAISALIFVFLATASERIGIIVLRNLTDSVAADPISIETVWVWGVLYPIFYLVAHIFWRGSGFTGMQWFMNLRTSAYRKLYEYLTLHSKDYFNSRFAGALTNKVSNAVDGAESIFEKILWQFLPLIVGLVWYVGIAWQSDFRLGVIIVAWAVLFLGANIWFAKILQPHAYKFASSLSALKGRIVDSLSNISLVHEYASVSGERKYIGGFVKNQHDTGLKQWRYFEYTLTINGILIFGFIFMMIGTSIYLFQNELISIGVIVMVIAIVTEMSSQLFFIGEQLRDTAENYGKTKEGLSEILKEHSIVNRKGSVDLRAEKGDIVFDNITFEYDNTRIFRDFSLKILSGEKVGLVGRSGAGKTTFVSLILRHFDIRKGEIKIDGQNISLVTLDSLRRAIAFVPQDTSMFHRSIRENIIYSNPSASENDVINSSKLAQAHDFIMKLPKGYDTLVGERGVKLSGGQRQRIAIARAFIKNAPILILDEATSSLDSESEHAVQESLEKLMKKRTVVAIAHRLSTLKKMDRIIVINEGKIVEDGDPNRLLKKKNGVFKTMWDHQVKGFIVDS